MWRIYVCKSGKILVARINVLKNTSLHDDGGLFVMSLIDFDLVQYAVLIVRFSWARGLIRMEGKLHNDGKAWTI